MIAHVDQDLGRCRTPAVIVYEDHMWQNFLPLVYMRGVFELLCGSMSLLERVKLLCPRNQVGVWCREGLKDFLAEQTGCPTNQNLNSATLLLNGRAVWRKLPEVDQSAGSWVGVDSKGQTVCVHVANTSNLRIEPATMLDSKRAERELRDWPRKTLDSSYISHTFTWPWEVVLANQSTLCDDWQSVRITEPNTVNVPHGSHVLAKDDVVLGEGTRIKPCVVIDAEDGPVWIGRRVTILPHTYIKGPAFIGDDCLIQSGAVIHEGTTIGERCKVGGEIEASIMQGFSNKQHDGFLGHSYVGSWVNVAADCINSDLKNTYGNVRVPINGREVDTGEMFVGMLIGDYSKTGINVSFPTGAVMGFCSSIFAPHSPKFIPSFSWMTHDSVEQFDERRGLEIARRAMSRREKLLTTAGEAAFLAVRSDSEGIESVATTFHSES